MLRAVIDTNVLVAALRSSRGASAMIIADFFRGKFAAPISTALMLEYQAVLLRPGLVPFSAERIDHFLMDFLTLAEPQPIFFNWRPLLADSKDDLVLELAIASGSGYIVTHNLGHFRAALGFKIEPVSPAGFLELL